MTLDPVEFGGRRGLRRDAAEFDVLLVDDHAVVRRGLRTFLDLTDDIEVVGEAPDGAVAVAEARRLAPDVILMDLLMPVMDGVSAIAAIKQAQPEVEIVAVTSFIEEDKVTAALEAGASGYLLKDADAEAVAAAVRAAHAGEVHLDPAVARLLAQRMRERKTSAAAGRAAHRAREGGPLARRPGRQQQGDRLGAVHHRAHGADPRQQHPGQARAVQPHPGGALRGRAQAGHASRLTRTTAREPSNRVTRRMT